VLASGVGHDLRAVRVSWVVVHLHHAHAFAHTAYFVVCARVRVAGVSNSIGVLHPFGIDRAIEYVQKNMQTWGFEVVSA
jgi:hypothetical protein